MQRKQYARYSREFKLEAVRQAALGAPVKVLGCQYAMAMAVTAGAWWFVPTGACPARLLEPPAQFHEAERVSRVSC
jgi:hypothetical protein